MKDYNKENIPLAKALRKSPLGSGNCGMIFYATIRFVFKGKKRLEIISQTFIVLRRG